MKKEWKYTLIEESGTVDIYYASTFFHMIIKVLEGKIRRSLTNWKR